MDTIYTAFAGLTTVATIGLTALFGSVEQTPEPQPTSKVIVVTGCAGLLPENITCP